MTVPELADYLDIDDLLMTLTLFHLAELNLLLSVIVLNHRAQLVTLNFNGCIVGASDEALYLYRLLECFYFACRRCICQPFHNCSFLSPFRFRSLLTLL